MADAKDVTSSPSSPPADGIQAAPPTEVTARPPGPDASASVKLSPARQPQPRAALLPAALARSRLRLDVALVALVLGLAFLLAAFPVRNSDFWLHLATGRLIAAG